MPRYRAAPAGGLFVRAKGDPRGIGKVVHRTGDEVTVEYFHSIADQELVVVPRGEVIGVYLSKQTRCYLYDEEEQRWHMGRIGERDGREYEVNLPDRQSVWVSEACVFTRSNRLVADPMETLVLKGHETAFFHASRLRLVKSLVFQRAAAHGLTALTSARIELFPHQVEAVRRVLEDPIERYLLADEVGLGKTIEAGVLIRQYLLDAPTGDVLVVVPPYLQRQWKSELDGRFDALRDERVSVVSTSGLGGLPDIGSLGMLVVDEAHHVASDATAANGLGRQRFALLQHLADHAERVVLLSATPAASNERQFLAMLHLLDPHAYRLDDLGEFEERVRIRQEVGRLLLTLTEDAVVFSLKLSLKRLRQLFPSDGPLAEYSEHLARALDADFSATEGRAKLIRAIRTHISETYRLHRRMVRSRRNANPDAIVDRSRSSLNVAYDESESARQVDSLIEEWRVLAASALHQASPPSAPEVGIEQVFLALAQSADGAPAVLEQVLRHRLGTGSEGVVEFLAKDFSPETIRLVASVSLFPGEEEVLRGLLEVAREQAAEQRRLHAVVDLLKRLRDGVGGRPPPKCIVFCGFASIAQAVADHLAGRFGKRTVGRHLVGTTPDAVEAEVRRFQLDRDCFVMVCDRSGEEGRNFAFVEHMIHFDLPWQPNRIEQRVGRVDRIGRTRDLHFHVLLGPDSALGVHRAWFRFLADGLRVFRASIASLQFYTDAKLPQAVRRAFELGSQGLAELIPVMKEEIEAEQEKVDEQDAIDAIDTRDDNAVQFQESLDRADMRHVELREAVEGWLCTVLGFGRDLHPSIPGCLRYREERSTLVPASERHSRFGPFLDRLGTYDRTVAAQHPEIALYRPGEGLMDALAEYIEWDDRGRTFAIWRQEPTWDSRDGAEWVGFRFDLVVEADTSAAHNALRRQVARGTSAKALDHQADALFPPGTETVFIDSGLHEVDDSHLLSCLRRPFSKGVDHNLTKNWVGAIDAVVAADVWERLCRDARDAALRLVRERPQLRARCDQAAAHAARRLEIRMERLRLRAIRGALGGPTESTSADLQLEREVGEALIEGIRQPRVRVDSVGLIVLSGRWPFHDSPETTELSDA